MPPGKFDVIFLLSAIHYASDQEFLIDNIMNNHIERDGILVLEIGIIDNFNPPEWLEIDRGIDKRLFANWMMIDKILSKYAWKIVSASAKQKGDPTERFAIHIRNKKNYAILLTKPSGYGKTAISRSIFSQEISVVSLDTVVLKIFNKEIFVSNLLYTAIAFNFSRVTLFNTYKTIGELSLYGELLDAALQEQKYSSVAIDGYIPENFIESVIEILEDKNYFVINLNWQNANIPDHNFSNTLADLYFDQFSQDKSDKVFTQSAHIDSIVNETDGVTQLYGWAVSKLGNLPDNLRLTIDGQAAAIKQIIPLDRPDVQSHFHLPTPKVGFCIHLFHPKLEKNNFYRRILVNKDKVVTLSVGDKDLFSKSFKSA